MFAERLLTLWVVCPLFQKQTRLRKGHERPSRLNSWKRWRTLTITPPNRPATSGSSYHQRRAWICGSCRYKVYYYPLRAIPLVSWLHYLGTIVAELAQVDSANLCLCVLGGGGDLRLDGVKWSPHESQHGLSASSLTMLRGAPRILSAAEEPRVGCYRCRPYILFYLQGQK